MIIIKKKYYFLLFLIILVNKLYPEQNFDVQTAYTLTLPPFGKFEVTGTVDIPNVNFTLAGSKNKIFNLGFLEIENPTISISNKKGLGASAKVNILDKSATLSMIEFIPNKIVSYKIKPENLINIAITPWNNIDINYFIFSITNNFYELTSDVSIFGHDAKFIFAKKRPPVKIDGTEQEIIKNPIKEPAKNIIEVKTLDEIKQDLDSYAQITLNSLTPADLIESAKNTDINLISLQDSTFLITDPFNKLAKHNIKIFCTANFEKLKLPKAFNLSKLDAQIDLNQEGFVLTTQLKDTNILENINLEEITLKVIVPKRQTKTITPNQQAQPTQQPVNKPSIFLSGIANLDLPLIGKLKTQFNAIYDKNKFNFYLDINKEINLENIASLQNCSLNFSSDGNIEIVGQTKILDLNLIGKLKLSKTAPAKPAQTQQTIITPETSSSAQATSEPNLVAQEPQTYTKFGNYYIEFSAQGLGTVKPFEKISGVNNIKQIRDISITDPAVTIGSDKLIKFSGLTDILNFKSNSTIEIKSTKEITLKCQAPENWRISDAITTLQGSFFDELDLSNIKIIISSYTHFDPNLKIIINNGFNMLAGTQLTGGVFNSAKVLMGDIKKQLTVAGSFGDSPTDTYLAIAIPVPEIKLSEKALLQNISFVLVGKGPAMGFKTRILIRPSEQDSELIFTGEIAIQTTPPSGVLKATMQGEWENPLGIKGISLSDLAAQIAITLTPPTPTPSTIGLTGLLKLSKNKKIFVATNYSIDGQIVLMGEYDGDILLEDILAIPAKLNPNINIKKLKNKVPDMGFRDTLFKFAPLPTKIGEIEFDQGISLAGKLFFLDKEAFINLNLNSDGLIAQGYIPEFNIGPIKISGTGLDGIYGTKDDGATLDLMLTPEDQHLLISGLADILIAKGQTDILINKNKVNMFLLGQLFKVFETKFEIESVGSLKELDKLDLIFKATLNNDLNDFLIKNIIKYLNIFDSSVKNTITENIQKLDNIDSKIDSLDIQIKEKKAKIKEYEKIKTAKKNYKGLI